MLSSWSLGFVAPPTLGTESATAPVPVLGRRGSGASGQPLLLDYRAETTAGSSGAAVSAPCNHTHCLTESFAGHSHGERAGISV